MSEVNRVLPQFETFYESYDIKEGDCIYIAPENRVGICKIAIFGAFFTGKVELIKL